jgi:hypothetical protein
LWDLGTEYVTRTLIAGLAENGIIREIVRKLAIRHEQALAV